MTYEWDPLKAASNFAKHGVRFADAVGVFEDDQALSQPDDRAIGEERFVAVGTDYLGRVLTVVFTYRGEEIRLISARMATAAEKDAYERR